MRWWQLLTSRRGHGLTEVDRSLVDLLDLDVRLLTGVADGLTDADAPLDLSRTSAASARRPSGRRHR